MSESGCASFNGPKPLNLPRERGYCRVEWQGERFARSQLLWKFNRPLYAALMRLRELGEWKRERVYAYVSSICRGNFRCRVSLRKCFAIFVLLSVGQRRRCNGRKRNREEGRLTARYLARKLHEMTCSNFISSFTYFPNTVIFLCL